MSDNIRDIDVDSEEYEDTPRALREHVKKLQKEYKSALTERDDWRSKFQTRAASDVLSDFGFRNTKRVSRDLLSDGVDLSDTDAVKAWVEENGDDYAKTTGTEEANPAPKVDHSEEQAQRQVLQQATQGAQPANVDKFEAAVAEITPDMDGAAVQALYRKYGI